MAPVQGFVLLELVDLGLLLSGVVNVVDRVVHVGLSIALAILRDSFALWGWALKSIILNFDYVVDNVFVDVPYIGYLAIVDGGKVLLGLCLLYLSRQIVRGRPWLFRLNDVQVLANLDLTPAVIYVHVGITERVTPSLIVASFLRAIPFAVLNVLASLNQERLEVDAMPL